jgi:signal transduction histidine kinase
MFVVAGLLLWIRRGRFDRQVWQMLLGFIALTVLSELAFTIYDDPYAAANTVGHLLRAAAYFCLFWAVVEVGLARPYELLFRTLAQSRQALLELNRDLEQRVSERTHLAEQRAQQIKQLAIHLGQTERRERRRLASLLHDHLQQLLVAARMYLSILDRKLKDPALQEDARRIDGLLEDSIAASRSLTVQLAPPVLQEEGLAGALTWLAQWMRSKHELEVQCAGLQEGQDISEDTRNLAFEAARELLFNVVKHAGVKHAQVEVARAGSELRLTVSDQGNGFRPKAPPVKDSGFGLSDLRQRMELAGGSLDIESEPERGTRVTVRLRADEPGTQPERGQASGAAAAAGSSIAAVSDSAAIG